MKGLLAIPTTFVDWEHFETYCRNVGRLKRQLPWIVGQLMVRGESAFGERVYQIAEIFGYNIESVRNFASVCRTITVDEYTDALDWSSWQALSAVKDSKSRAELVTRALAGDLGRDALREAIKAQAVSTLPEPIPTPQAAPNARQQALLAVMIPLITPFANEAMQAWTRGSKGQDATMALGKLKEAGDALWDAWVNLAAELEKDGHAGVNA